MAAKKEEASDFACTLSAVPTRGQGYVLLHSKNEPRDLPRPDPIKCTAPETTDHAYGLVRVLDFDGNASGPWNPELTPDELREGLEHMVRMRIFDDRMMKMQRTGKLSFYMRSFEKRLLQSRTMALENQDWIFPYSQTARSAIRQR